MATMESMSPEVRTFVKMYKWQRIDPVPRARSRRPLAEARIGLVITACMTMPDQPPFEAEQPDNDPSLRIVPSDIDPRVLVNTFPGQAFDHAGIQGDPDLLMPLDRLREMHERGEIGRLTPRTVSLCGHLPKPRALLEGTAPEIARIFVEDAADVVMLVPA